MPGPVFVAPTRAPLTPVPQLAAAMPALPVAGSLVEPEPAVHPVLVASEQGVSTVDPEFLSAAEALQAVTKNHPSDHRRAMIEATLGGLLGLGMTALGEMPAAMAGQSDDVAAIGVMGLMSVLMALATLPFVHQAFQLHFQPRESLVKGASYIYRNWGFTDTPTWSDLKSGQQVHSAETLKEAQNVPGLALCNGVEVAAKKVVVENNFDPGAISGGTVTRIYRVELQLNLNGQHFDAVYRTQNRDEANLIEHLPDSAQICILADTHREQIRVERIFQAQTTRDLKTKISDRLEKNLAQFQPYHCRGILITADSAFDDRIATFPDDVKRDALLNILQMIWQMPDSDQRRVNLHGLFLNQFLNFQDQHYRREVLQAVLFKLNHSEKEKRADAVYVLQRAQNYGAFTVEEKKWIAETVHDLALNSVNQDVRNDMLQVVPSFAGLS